MKNYSSSGSSTRIARLRAKYRKKLCFAVILCLLIGIIAGVVLDRTVLPRYLDPLFSNSSVTPSPTPEGNRIGRETTPAPSAVNLTTNVATPTPTPTSTPAPTPAPDIIIPVGESYSFTSEILENGSGRLSVEDVPYEKLNFTVRATRYLTPEYYAENYANRYRLNGTEAGIEFELTVNDYMGSTVLVPQNLFVISAETRDGEIVRGYQLTDAEIYGQSDVMIETNIPKMVYKRFAFDPLVGDMAYLCIEIFNNGVTQKLMFELETPVRVTPSPAATIYYNSLQLGSSGADVVRLQARLIDMGYLTGDLDGSFGSMTVQAVKAAQAAFNLETTGIADHALLSKLYG